MESVLGRYRNLIVLAAVLFAQVLGLAVQVKRTTDTEPTRLIRVWAVSAVTPFEKALVWTRTSTRNLWHNYFYLRGVRAENRELKQEIQRMRLEQVRMSQDADQARRLQALLSFKEQFISKTLPAQVIGSSGSELSRALFIDKGEKDGIRPDMAVITAGGIVGKVLHVYRSTSLVLLINDQTSGVGAILEKSRLQGILRGTPAGELVLEKVMSDETVPAGEQVVTSGGDRIFPKGLPVGTVTRVSPGSDLFLNIRVKPAANLSKLEEVLVVTKVDERQAVADVSGPARTADILAQRLPSVPPKPENAPSGASATQAGAPKVPSTSTGAGVAPKTNPQAIPDVKAKTQIPAGPPVAAPSPRNATTAASPGAAASPRNSTTAAGSSQKVSAPATPGGAKSQPSTPGAANSGTTVVRKPAPSAATGENNTHAAGKATVKISQKPAKPPVEPKRQPPPEDNPQ